MKIFPQQNKAIDIIRKWDTVITYDGEYMRNIQNIVVISNISVEPFFVPILQERENTAVIAVPCQEYRQSGHRSSFKEADIIIIWLNLEVLLPEIHSGVTDSRWKEEKAEKIRMSCRDMAKYITLYSGAMVTWLLFEDYFLHLAMATGHRGNSFVEKVNQGIQEELPDETVVIDLKYLIAEMGIGAAFSAKNKYRWNFPYSKLLAVAVANEVQKQYFIENGISKKCLVLDCDNVLWGGILSEDGMGSIRLGSSGLGLEYQEFQRFVLSLYYRGVILAICSKNDRTDVLRVFREHSGMILKEEHIACFQVNWKNKTYNIRQIAVRLNIGTESMVFVDDSPFEIEAVKAFLPEVTTIPYHRETMYAAFSCFHLKENPGYGEVVKRNDAYRTEVFRQEIKAKCDSYNEYLAALEMKIDIHEIVPAEYGRIAELTQRTNKCTNGVRCTVANIREWADSMEGHLYTVTYADKFSDMGIVGGFGIRDDKLALFSLSCRVLGREIEDEMLRYIQERYRITEYEFRDTGKNDNLKLLLEKLQGSRNF